LQGPLHFTGVASAGGAGVTLYEANTNKLKEPTASNSSSMAERFIISVNFRFVGKTKIKRKCYSFKWHMLKFDYEEEKSTSFAAYICTYQLLSMNNNFVKRIASELEEIDNAGLVKKERIIKSAQGPEIIVGDKRVLNFCANNYLGLSSHPKVLEAAKKYIDHRGYGLSSVRFICGTQDIHKELEQKIADFLGTEDTILYAAAFDANGGVFEPLFNEQDAIISDALNHASIIDGVRLCKAQRYRYEHNNMEDLEAKLKEAAALRSRIIVTDGSFSMDGTIAQLDKICDLADQYDAIVMIDECHSSGFLGKTGRGTHEYRGVMGRIDIITGTLGKALGGASGGFTSGRKEIIEMLRQRSRPYLFSNTVAPSIVGASIVVLGMLSETTELRDKLAFNTQYFRNKMTAAGFDIKPGEHPIVPIMLYDAVLAQNFAAALLEEGIYVIGFFFPVVAKGQARIRVQLSAAHEVHHLDQAITAFTKIGRQLGVLK
jgi:glycine C-acetyltransferase